MKTLAEYTYQPTMDDLTKATADLESALASAPPRERMTLMVAADEIFANIVHHSGATEWTLKVEETDEGGVLLTLADDGSPFDPLAQRDPDTTLSLDERRTGGLGILIVKRTMSPVTYERKGKWNILRMGMTCEGSAAGAPR